MYTIIHKETSDTKVNKALPPRIKEPLLNRFGDKRKASKLTNSEEYFKKPHDQNGVVQVSWIGDCGRIIV